MIKVSRYNAAGQATEIGEVETLEQARAFLDNLAVADALEAAQQFEQAVINSARSHHSGGPLEASLYDEDEYDVNEGAENVPVMTNPETIA